MTREYFLVDSLAVTEQVTQHLHHKLQVKNHHLHVLSLDTQGLQQHHLNPATLIQKRDLIRGLELGALSGATLGMGLYIFAIFALLLVPLSADLKSLIFVAAFAVPLLVGSLLGACIGARAESYKIRRFHEELEAGRHVLMIDTDQQHCSIICREMRLYPLEGAGEDSTLILPFSAAPVAAELKAAA